jgi:hypothetical protein
MNQGPLAAADWALWRQALTKCFCSRGQSLRQPLGKWTRTPTSTWRWYFDTATERLLEQHNGTVKVYSRKAGRPSRRAQLKFVSSISSTATDITPTAVPAKVYRQGSLLVVIGWAPISTSPRQQKSTSLQEFVRLNVHPDAAWAVKGLTVGNEDDGRAVATSISNGSFLAISDGSFKDQHGTASWIVQGEDSFGAFGSSLITPENPEDQSAHRSELAGLFGIATIVDLLCQYYDITEGTVTIGYDGLQALVHATSSVDFTSTKMAQFDLVGATRTMLRRSPVSWKAEHVLGHQDDDVHATLDRKAMMNVTMDGEAKFHWISTVS